jgi:hypothetical protein
MLLATMGLASIIQAGVVEKGDLRVEWTWVHQGIIHQIFDIKIQNLAYTERTVDVLGRISDVNFPLRYLKNVKFYIWMGNRREFTISDFDAVAENLLIENVASFGLIPKPDYVDVGDLDSKHFAEGTLDNGDTLTAGFDSYDSLGGGSYWIYYDVWRVVGTHLENKIMADWRRITPERMKLYADRHDTEIGELVLPPVDSPVIRDDFGTPIRGHGTLGFRIEFDLPITTHRKGWGSCGKIALWLDGEEFHPWWDETWPYRVPITLNIGENVPPENYQYKIVLDNVDNLGGHVAFENFQDLRFLENENVGELSYWFESYVSGDSVVTWVKRTENALTDNTIYCYYGNPNAASAEDGDATFLLFDDMQSDQLADWITNGGTWSWDTDNYKVVWTGGRSNAYQNPPNNENYAYAATIRRASGTVGEAGLLFYCDSVSADAGNTYLFRLDGTNAQLYRVTGGTWDSLGSTAHSYTGTWYDFEVRVRTLSGGTHFFCYINDSLIFDYLDTSAGRYTEGKAGVRFGVNSTFGFDNAIVRRYIFPEPSASAGAEEKAPNRPPEIISVIPDNTLIDRDDDGTGFSVVLGTKITADVKDNNKRDDIHFDNVKLSIRDNVGNWVVENVAFDSYENIDENTKRFTYNSYNPSDALSDAALGSFDIRVIATDNENAALSDTEDNLEAFTVDDLNASISIDNDAPEQWHDITISGDAFRVSGAAISLDNVLVVDDKEGTIQADYNSDNYSKVYVVTSGVGVTGEIYANLDDGVLEGKSENTVTYTVAPTAPEILSVSSGEVLIDRKADSELFSATTTTTITARIRDNNGRDGIVTDNVRVWIRDNSDAYQIENVAFTGYDNVDENTKDFTYSYDANDSMDNSLFGTFDIMAWVDDNTAKHDNLWNYENFEVDDLLLTTPAIDDDTPLQNQNITITGAASRINGAISLDNAKVYDNAEIESFTATVSDVENYTVTYKVESIAGTVGYVWGHCLDDGLDGKSDPASYTIQAELAGAIPRVDIRMAAWAQQAETIKIRIRVIDANGEFVSGANPRWHLRSPENNYVVENGTMTTITELGYYENEYQLGSGENLLDWVVYAEATVEGNLFYDVYTISLKDVETEGGANPVSLSGGSSAIAGAAALTGAMAGSLVAVLAGRKKREEGAGMLLRNGGQMEVQFFLIDGDQ